MSTIICTSTADTIAPLLKNNIEKDTRDGWVAELSLRYTQRGDKTVLKHRSQKGPLAIQRPLYPEGNVCHTYLLHPPGGVVGGDSLNIDVEVERDAHVLITTPGATKFYRSEEKYAHQKQTLHVRSGARLEWLPQENIFFPNAYSRLDTQVHLDSGAQFVGWELHCFGRPALKEGFNFGHLIGKTELFYEGKRIITEGLNFHGGDKFIINNGLLGYSMMGTLFITDNRDSLFELVQSLLLSIKNESKSTHHQDALSDELVLGVTQLDGILVVRALGHWSEDILNAFSQVWQTVRKHWTGEEPSPPRIWAT